MDEGKGQFGCLAKLNTGPQVISKDKDKDKDKGKDTYKDKYKDKDKYKYKSNRLTYDVICFWKAYDNRNLIMKKW